MSFICNRMTLLTQRHNVQPILFGIAFIVMIVLGLLAALGAVEGFRWRNLTCLNRVIHNLARFVFFRIPISVALNHEGNFIRVVLFPFLSGFFYFFGVRFIPFFCVGTYFIEVSLISLAPGGVPAFPANTPIPIFVPFVFTKLSQLLYLLTFPASFFAHRFSIKQKATALHLPFFCGRNKHLHKAVTLCRQIKNALFLPQFNYTPCGAKT